MTYGDIYTKFEIEYDKAQMASSYPSLTKLECATILDKAYLALLAQKLTGNNPRQTAFEGDSKAIEDVRPLLKRESVSIAKVGTDVANEYVASIPNDLNMLYYIVSMLKVSNTQGHSSVPVNLVNHEDAMKFKATNYNLPWVKIPVCYVEGDNIYILIDPRNHTVNTDPENNSLEIEYMKKPISFVTEYYKEKDPTLDPPYEYPDFELNDTMAEELINLAIILSAEIVESPRQQTKTTFRPLES